MDDLLKFHFYRNSVDISFETVMSQLHKGDIVITEKYDWSGMEIDWLATCLIKNIPIAPIYCYKQNNVLFVLEGSKRLMSLFLYFTHNRNIDDTLYVPGTGYNLSKVSDGKSTFKFSETDITFKNFSDESKRYLRFKYISFVIIEVNTDDNSLSKQEVYNQIKLWLKL